MTAAAGKAAGPTRRDVLIRSGWLATGATVLSACSLMPVLPEMANPEIEDSLLWVQMLPSGRARFFCPRMEMGQGATIGLTQVVAEALNLTVAEVDCVSPNTAHVPPFKMTVGSDSLRLFFAPTSYAAARLREALRQRAAEQSGAHQDEIRNAPDGFMLPNGRRLAYAELVPTRPLMLDGNGAEARHLTQAKRGHRGAIGREVASPSLEAIVTGREVYSQDASLPGMLYGQVVRPPYPGAELRGVEAGDARKIKDVVSILIDLDRAFIGIAAENPFVLDRAAAAIKADWSPYEPKAEAPPRDIFAQEARAADGGLEHDLTDTGDLPTGSAQAVQRVAARYETSFLAHAAMEPRAALVSAATDKVEVWCGTQAPFFVRDRVARLLSRARDDVVLHPLRMGGGFGGRVPCQPAEDAALLSQATGRPVRVQWRREDEFRHNYFQPPFLHEVEAGVTSRGRISHWRHDFASAPIIYGPVPEPFSWIMDLLADKGTGRGARPPYHIAHKRVRYSDIRIPVPTGAWRGLGAAPNAFAIESMVDELAVAAKLDPLKFRLRNLTPKDGRLAAVLARVGQMANWGQQLPKGIGQGLACAVYRDATFVAIAVQMHVNKTARSIRVDQVWCAHDCGLIVNPDQVRAQIEGNIIWGCGMALQEQMSFADGGAESDNFHLYHPIRHGGAPKIEISLLDRPDISPAGAGEPAIAPMPAAIANAVFAATGKRPRKLPFDYDSLFGPTG